MRPLVTAQPRSRAALVVVAALIASFAGEARAYSVEGGNLLVRPLAGVALNVLRLDVATRATPPAGMLTGVDVDYSLDGAWNLAFAYRPALSPGFVDHGVGLGVKYRVVQLEAPFIPYVAGLASTSFGAPLGYGDLHVRLGARAAGGIDYFVLRNLALGLELGAELGGLVTPLPQLELTTTVLAGLTWKF